MATASRPGKTAISQPTDREVLMTRVFDAPRKLVWDAWTRPEHVKQWLLGPEGWTMPVCEMDFRPGGAWFRCMRAPGGTEHRKRGVYREIVAPERLIFTYASEDAEGNRGHETLVTVTFADFGGKTRLTLHQAVFESVAARDAHQGGWTSCLERFAEYLANA